MRSILASKQLPAWKTNTNTVVGHVGNPGEPGGESWLPLSTLADVPSVERRPPRSDATRCRNVWLNMLSSGMVQ